MQEKYFVYIIECSDKSYYVGVTERDLLEIFELHEKGISGCYTFLRRPLKLMYYEVIPFKKDALERQQQFRGWSRAKKKALIEHNFHKLQLLSECQNMSHHKYKDVNSPATSTNAFDFAQDLKTRPSTSLRPYRIGILGGGQLGRMLLQTAANYPVETFVLENDPECPSAHLCRHFTKGNIRNFDDVYNFGKKLDAITIEIESVNVDALELLEKEGLKVFPRPAVIRTIKNKIDQKEFFKQHEIPSPEFVVTAGKNELYNHLNFLPAVHKIGIGGYDGRGVQVIRSEADIPKGFDAPSVLEKMVNIKAEIAIIVARGTTGDLAVYPAVEMVMDPELNPLDYQMSPAGLNSETLSEAETIAKKLINEISSPGIYAIEFFVDYNNKVWVNEMAPRVHNSGHHTIEASYCSQFDMLWRVMMNYPLGNTSLIKPSCMVNVLGADNSDGNAIYEGLDEVLELDNAFVHLYGKHKTKAGRKMGHVTLVGDDKAQLVDRTKLVKHKLRVISK